MYSEIDYRTAAPTYTTVQRVDGKVVNDCGFPLWSGPGPLPIVGTEITCNDRKGTACVVLGYRVYGKWLMVAARRKDDAAEIGTLAGAEILFT